MKLFNYFIAISAGIALWACSDITTALPEGGTILDKQLKETTTVLPERADASFSGMFFKLSNPLTFGNFSQNRPDDFGFAMIDFSNDLEAADIILANSGYNWFSVCGDLTSRTASYANPYIRYVTPFLAIGNANAYLSNFDEPSIVASGNKEILAKIGEAKAIRAYANLTMAPMFQFNQSDSDLELLCIPIVTEKTTDFTNNPRASVKAVYDQIFSDLNDAVKYLEGYVRPDKSKIDQQVAYGLRARAHLNMRHYEEALADAKAAAEGYTPASIAEVSSPSFKDINEHNWLWGYDQTVESAATFPFASPSGWIRSFSAYSYSAACQVYSQINKLLWDKIPDTDVRKGWWVDENLESPLLEGLVWPGFSDVANADDGGDSKTPYVPYTNVKFGCNTIGTNVNDEDWPMMRVEEMILIQAECLAMISGKEEEAQQVLSDFVKTYRNPEYEVFASAGKTLVDKIWFQRRIELWGEGFANNDTRRLAKPLVRFHNTSISFPLAFPAEFRFNMEPRDGWWLLRFPQDELDTNLGIVDNTGGNIPVQDQKPELRDGVTD